MKPSEFKCKYILIGAEGDFIDKFVGAAKVPGLVHHAETCEYHFRWRPGGRYFVRIKSV